MIKSPEHDINRAGELLMRSVFEPLNWLANYVREDYGLDFNVEVFDGKSSTGIWFHVQLKSSASSEYSQKSDFVSQNLSIEHARYFAIQLRQPVLLVHIDTVAKRVFWHAPQLDRHLRTVLEQSKTQSVTVRIPTSQELPKTAPQLLQDLDKIYALLGARVLTSNSAISFADTLPDLPDQEALHAKFQQANDDFKLRKSAELFSQRKYDQVRSRATAILADPDSSVGTKFWAQIQIEGADFAVALHSGAPQNALSEALLKNAKALQRLTADGPRHLKFFALIKRKAAELQALAHEHFTLFVAHQQHLQGRGNPMMVLTLYTKRVEATSRVIAKYNQCVRLARLASTFPDRWMLGRALTDIPKAAAPYIITLRSEADREVEASFQESIIQISKLSVYISQETGDATGVLLAITSSLAATNTTDSEIYRWADGVARGITDPKLHAQTLEAIERIKRRWKGEYVEGDYRGNVIWQLIQNISKGLEIDISDETTPFVRALKIAANDNSPERVLAHCEHIMTSLGSTGPIAAEIRAKYNLSTAGSKMVHCTRHDRHTEGRDYDSAYDRFKQEHCAGCPDSRPRPEGWKYTTEIQKEMEARHFVFIDKLSGTRNGVRYAEKD